VLAVPLLFALWRSQASRGAEPGDLSKIAIGAAITAASNLILVLAIAVAGAGLVPPVWPLLYSVGLGIGFMYYWPTLLALVSRSAPPRVNATLMGVTFMTLFVAGNLIGWLGTWYEKMRAADFWALHAAIAAGGGLLIALLRRPLERTLNSVDTRGRSAG
jgi:POT family proton-dependent oligopeptide transporter